jgi:ubiquinone/menaquinone biosynthesis C-methylase UbiE
MEERQTMRDPDLSSQWLNYGSDFCGSFAGKKILDVGCDLEGKLITEIRNKYRPLEVVGINLAAENRELFPNCRMETGDIRGTQYSDGYFDIIVSASAFEHIHNFELAVREMHRILKPAGFIYAGFGPIWSTCYGHHMWFLHQGQLYNYWNVILPAFCHLLMTPDELFEYCRKAYNQELSEMIVSYVFHSPHQNHLFYEDYEQIIGNSRFDVLFFKGYDHRELRALYTITSQTIDNLRHKYPRNRHFLYDGIMMLLRK